ncbi:hypothetical protein F5B21DRAFT_432769 [Xylaria acuta]|nr:hypothetical protein F5B21DRAFT_432769 [Xylaria acuta]
MQPLTAISFPSGGGGVGVAVAAATAAPDPLMDWILRSRWALRQSIYMQSVPIGRDGVWTRTMDEPMPEYHSHHYLHIPRTWSRRTCSRELVGHASCDFSSARDCDPVGAVSHLTLARLVPRRRAATYNPSLTTLAGLDWAVSRLDILTSYTRSVLSSN